MYKVLGTVSVPQIAPSQTCWVLSSFVAILWERPKHLCPVFLRILSQFLVGEIWCDGWLGSWWERADVRVAPRCSGCSLAERSVALSSTSSPVSSQPELCISAALRCPGLPVISWLHFCALSPGSSSFSPLSASRSSSHGMQFRSSCSPGQPSLLSCLVSRDSCVITLTPL